MDFHITMDDGSEFLAHHGVKGMQWGVWNDETKAKYGYGGNSKRGDKLRKKAAGQRTLAEKARSNTAFVDEASRAHTGEITKHYSAANAHLVKGQAHKSMAKGLRAEADAQRLAGKERKAKRLEKKADKQERKAETENLREEESRKKGQKAANRFEREEEARSKLAREATKRDLKANKLEMRAEKADAKMERKTIAQLEKMRSTAKGIAESEKAGKDKIATSPYQRLKLREDADDFLTKSNDAATSEWSEVILKDLPTGANKQKKAAYEARVEGVLRTSLKEAGLRAKEVDKVMADLLQDIEEYEWDH